ncbi:MAG: NUDIX domain-containing protein [candidate division Zixibacteria bacterium]|nr:NUDIX domain-containing protein [candidate division Zixibacteria bacterium]
MTEHLQAEIVQTAVLVNARGEALILRRPAGKWQLPGGRLNAGEQWDEGLRREIREETGIDDVEILSIMMLDNWVYEGVPMYGVFLLCRTQKTEVRLSTDHDEFRWVTLKDDLRQFDFWHDSLRILVERALQMR